MEPKLKNYPRPDEPPLEDLTKEEAWDDVESEGRKPDLGELEDDASEL